MGTRPEILVPADGAESWRRLLAEPDTQWKKGFSARTLAYCWHERPGLPRSVEAAFRASPYDVFHDVEMLVGLPEHKVPLPGGSRSSQTDLWVLARSGADLDLDCGGREGRGAFWRPCVRLARGTRAESGAAQRREWSAGQAFLSLRPARARFASSAITSIPALAPNGISPAGSGAIHREACVDARAFVPPRLGLVRRLRSVRACARGGGAGERVFPVSDLAEASISTWAGAPGSSSSSRHDPLADSQMCRSCGVGRLGASSVLRDGFVTSRGGAVGLRPASAT